MRKNLRQMVRIAILNLRAAVTVMGQKEKRFNPGTATLCDISNTYTHANRYWLYPDKRR